MQGKCDVCGKTTEVNVCCSSCGAISFAYCKDCFDSFLEPYDALVGMLLTYDEINENYREQVLLPSLKFHNKTVEEFNSDVENLYKDMLCMEKQNHGMEDNIY